MITNVVFLVVGFLLGVVSGMSLMWKWHCSLQSDKKRPGLYHVNEDERRLKA